jgi:hypothetical protein
MRKLTNILLIIGLILITGVLLYTCIGTCNKVEKIKKIAPNEIAKRNWKILRYEGFQYSSWDNHGGKVWYHVQNIDNPNIQYRIYITMWNNELQYHYGDPEQLQRITITE